MKARSLCRLVAGALVLVLAMAAGSAGASDSSDGVDDGEASAEEAALDEAISTLEPAARKLWPDTFAGLWGSGDEGETLHIAFTEDAAENVERLAAGFPRPELLEPVTHERSMKELEAEQKEMIADRELAREGDLAFAGVPGHRYDLDIDEAENAVVVMLEDASKVATTAFEARYGDDIVFEEGPLGEPGCTRIDCRYSLRSGLRTVSPQGGWCSTAFTVRRPNGTRRHFSAGHCGPVGQVRRHGQAQGGERYGVVRNRQVAGRVDAMQIGPPEGRFSMLPRIFVNANNKFHAVRSRGGWGGIAPQQTRLCKGGSTTHFTCGLVLGKHHSPNWVPNSNRFVRANYCANSGDSGSGAFRQANWSRAEAIYSGGHVTVPCNQWNPNVHWSTAGHIEYALNQLGGTLVRVG